MISEFIRKKISKFFTGQKEIVFRNDLPSQSLLSEKFSDIDKIGLYLHIPFCERICPYCPYNKELYSEDLAKNYTKALKQEIENYASLIGDKPVTSFYIGGGSPSVMLGKGIEDIIDHIYKNFNMQCAIHMESHPNHLSNSNLDLIKSLGVKYLSIGIESLQDKHLKALERSYTVKEAKKNIEMAVNKNFECVNIDYIFDLPNQTTREIEEAGNEIVKLGVNQVATYPLFRFPYTKLNGELLDKTSSIGTMFRRRKFLKIFEDIFYASGFYRSSVWAFTQKEIDKYCSVTVPLYLGLGASGSSYLNDMFYVNTFKVKDYIHAMNEKKSAISLSIDLSEKMQMAGWLYWRIYETCFNKSDFLARFNINMDAKYGRLLKLWNAMGYLKNGEDQIRLTNRGAYWIHAFEDFFSINYINKLWGTSKSNAWPEEIIL